MNLRIDYVIIMMTFKENFTVGDVTNFTELLIHRINNSVKFVTLT